jgi:hypothetical protein
MLTNMNNTGNTGNTGNMGRIMRALAVTTVMGSLMLSAGTMRTMAAEIDAAPQAEPQALYGHLTFEARILPPSDAAKPAEVVVAQEGKVLQTANVKIAPDGTFQLSMGDLAEGKYQLWVKSPRYLAKQVDVDYTQGIAKAELGTLIAGDVDGNNVITVVDTTLLRSTLGKALGDPGYDARADFNYDDRVNVQDSNMMRNKTGLAGDPRP